MMTLLILALLVAFVGAIALTLRGLSRDSEAMMGAGVAAMILVGLQLGGALELVLS